MLSTIPKFSMYAMDYLSSKDSFTWVVSCCFVFGNTKQKQTKRIIWKGKETEHYIFYSSKHTDFRNYIALYTELKCIWQLKKETTNQCSQKHNITENITIISLKDSVYRQLLSNLHSWITKAFSNMLQPSLAVSHCYLRVTLQHPYF